MVKLLRFWLYLLVLMARPGYTDDDIEHIRWQHVNAPVGRKVRDAINGKAFPVLIRDAKFNTLGKFSLSIRRESSIGAQDSAPIAEQAPPAMMPLAYDFSLDLYMVCIGF